MPASSDSSRRLVAAAFALAALTNPMMPRCARAQGGVAPAEGPSNVAEPPPGVPAQADTALPNTAPSETVPPNTTLPSPESVARDEVPVPPELASPAEPSPTSVPPPPPPAPPAEEPHARLDYSDGTFYLRSVNDNIVFVPSGRVQIDTYAFSGPGVSDYHRSNGTGLKLNMFFRRFVIEFGGIIRKHWIYWVGGNFAPTTIDSAQNSISVANVYDGFIGYQPHQRLRFYVGQYNAPFTMENVTSSRWLDFMERALSVRTLATPYNKADGLLAWGETPRKGFEYQVGVFGGDGLNRPNVDNYVDAMGRFVFRPLAKRSDSFRLFHFGFGGRVGGRNNSFVRYNAPNLTTPGGYAFWQSTYTDTGGTKVAILPANLQAAVSGEVYVPFSRWDVRSEVVYVNEERRETPDATRTMTLREGRFWGVSGYVQLSFWLLGTARINGNPAGTYGVLRVPEGLGPQAKHGLQFLLRGELVRMNYSGASRRGTPGAINAETNNITVNVFQTAINYWATKHIRLTAEYSLYQFPGDAASNQAMAPGRASNAMSNAHVLSEYSFRVGLAL